MRASLSLILHLHNHLLKEQAGNQFGLLLQKVESFNMKQKDQIRTQLQKKLQKLFQFLQNKSSASRNWSPSPSKRSDIFLASLQILRMSLLHFFSCIWKIFIEISAAASLWQIDRECIGTRGQICSNPVWNTNIGPTSNTHKYKYKYMCIFPCVMVSKVTRTWVKWSRRWPL